MHGNKVFQRVRDGLAAVEAERNVRVLFACECTARKRTAINAARKLHSRRSGKRQPCDSPAHRAPIPFLLLAGALPRTTATTTCAFSTSTNAAEGTRPKTSEVWTRRRVDGFGAVTLTLRAGRPGIEALVAADLRATHGLPLPKRQLSTGSISFRGTLHCCAAHFLPCSTGRRLRGSWRRMRAQLVSSCWMRSKAAKKSVR